LPTGAPHRAARRVSANDQYRTVDFHHQGTDLLALL
jgi:hypothetical protein